MTKEQRHNPALKKKIKNEKSIDDNGKEILLGEAIRKREEILHHMEENTSKVFTLLNTSLVLIGAYMTGMALLRKNGQIPIFPFTSAIFLSMGAFTVSLRAFYPKHFDIIIKPSGLYSLKNKQKNEIIDKLLHTYLVIENRLLLQAKEKPFFSKIIIVFLISSVLEFIIAVLLSLDVVGNGLSRIVTGISPIIPIVSVCAIGYFWQKYRREKNDLKKYLEG